VNEVVLIAFSIGEVLNWLWMTYDIPSEITMMNIRLLLIITYLFIYLLSQQPKRQLISKQEQKN
jgi:hypothetical protein